MVRFELSPSAFDDARVRLVDRAAVSGAVHPGSAVLVGRIELEGARECSRELPVLGLLAESLVLSMPEPDWLWWASCDVELPFVESAFESALFDWSTEPSYQVTRTRTRYVGVAARAAAALQLAEVLDRTGGRQCGLAVDEDCWSSTWMPMPPPQPHGLLGDD